MPAWQRRGSRAKNWHRRSSDRETGRDGSAGPPDGARFPSAAPPEGRAANGVAAWGALFVLQNRFQILNLESILKNLVWHSGFGVASGRDLVINSLWQLAVGSWQLAVGSWQLAVGSW